MALGIHFSWKEWVHQNLRFEAVADTDSVNNELKV